MFEEVSCNNSFHSTGLCREQFHCPESDGLPYMWHYRHNFEIVWNLYHENLVSVKLEEKISCTYSGFFSGLLLKKSQSTIPLQTLARDQLNIVARKCIKRLVCLGSARRLTYVIICVQTESRAEMSAKKWVAVTVLSMWVTCWQRGQVSAGRDSSVGARGLHTADFTSRDIEKLFEEI